MSVSVTDKTVRVIKSQSILNETSDQEVIFCGRAL